VKFILLNGTAPTAKLNWTPSPPPKKVSDVNVVPGDPVDVFPGPPKVSERGAIVGNLSGESGTDLNSTVFRAHADHGSGGIAEWRLDTPIMLIRMILKFNANSSCTSWIRTQNMLRSRRPLWALLIATCFGSKTASSGRANKEGATGMAKLFGNPNSRRYPPPPPQLCATT
jgi:hypothetical protein